MSLFDGDTSKVHWPLWDINEDGVRTGEITPRDALSEGDYARQSSRLAPTATPGRPPPVMRGQTSWSKSCRCRNRNTALALTTTFPLSSLSSVTFADSPSHGVVGHTWEESELGAASWTAS